jgi:hypothetical protein
MAQITLDLGNAQQTARVVNAVCARFGYQDTVYLDVEMTDGIPNPETKNAFAKRMLIEWLRRQTRDYEYDLAKAAQPPLVVPDPPTIT